MKVSVEIDDIDLSMNSIEIEKVEIGNPKNSILPKAFSCEVIDIFAPLMNYFDNNIVIDMIKIDDIYLGLEFEAPGKTQGNWTTIMGNFKASESPSKSTKTVLIKKLILSNIRMDLAYRTGDRKIQKLAPIDHLEFNNISSEGGIPTEQITNIIFKQMLKSVFDKANLKNMLEGVLDPQGSTWDKMVEPFKDLFNANDPSDLSEEKLAS